LVEIKLEVVVTLLIKAADLLSMPVLASYPAGMFWSKA
jgi:hypothetical protein